MPRPHRKPIRIVSPYERWKEAHPGVALTYPAWLEIQIDAHLGILHRLMHDLIDTSDEEAGVILARMLDKYKTIVGAGAKA
jgi:hypothetical protein